ncbi:pentatricopeptide repeat-containing protein DOT4, chloroplastic-like [Phalaenopsis equestris]|uniref:pentatricopeptide repeat-containing protein DOT4, chloroplastic-like n=1 Tax=Phalaenopsis equestris TaxID=78828 RepID=UPI0009E37528|nr:pentatricopeptide repeat-containing protein DOT4, chloroplastic-like [Phalaenopsis equestris]
MELHSSFTRSLQESPQLPNNELPIFGSSPKFLKPPPARHSFDKIPLLIDTFSWNALLHSHITAGDPHAAILSYRDMLLAGVLPDRHSLPRALTASRLASAFFTGRQLHSHALKLRLLGDSYVLSALMELYSQFGGANSASSLLFHSNPQTPIAYTLLARLYLMENNPDSALHVFYQLVASGIKIDAIAVATATKACGQLKSARDGKKIYEFAKERKLDCDLLVTNSLLKMYVDCGRMEERLALFDSMPHKDAVSWTTIITSYAQNGSFNEALKLFRAMMADGIKPDEFSVSAVLPACARVAARKHGMEIHGFIIRQHIEMNTAVQNALSDMYAKSGTIEYASKIFDGMSERDSVSLTVMILGYSLHGHGDVGVALFNEIEKDGGTEPDGATYAAALHCCGTNCILDQGENFFKMAFLKHSELQHCILMARILARTGRFSEAQTFLKDHRIEHDPDALRAILDGCRIHLNTKIGRRIAEQLIELNPLNAQNYVLLSNLHAANGNRRKVMELREMMVDMGLKPKKACSWIEFRSKIHAFSTGDVSHPRSERIYWELKGLVERMREKGYVFLEDFSFHDVDEERECIHYGHSEMLAIAFGLISTEAGTVIRVTKNMRVCRNCHESAKMISIICGREIMLRDPDRFHRFVDGSCSCQDIW